MASDDWSSSSAASRANTNSAAARPGNQPAPSNKRLIRASMRPVSAMGDRAAKAVTPTADDYIALYARPARPGSARRMDLRRARRGDPCGDPSVTDAERAAADRETLTERWQAVLPGNRSRAAGQYSSGGPPDGEDMVRVWSPRDAAAGPGFRRVSPTAAPGRSPPRSAARTSSPPWRWQ